jgi:hypothetical protein
MKDKEIARRIRIMDSISMLFLSDRIRKKRPHRHGIWRGKSNPYSVRYDSMGEPIQLAMSKDEEL